MQWIASGTSRAEQEADRRRRSSDTSTPETWIPDPQKESTEGTQRREQEEPGEKEEPKEPSEKKEQKEPSEKEEQKEPSPKQKEPSARKGSKQRKETQR